MSLDSAEYCVYRATKIGNFSDLHRYLLWHLQTAVQQEKREQNYAMVNTPTEVEDGLELLTY